MRTTFMIWHFCNSKYG